MTGRILTGARGDRAAAARAVGVVLGLALLPGVVLAATFGWTGGGADDDWDTCDNWTVTGIPACYPSANGDDVSIGYNASGWSVNLIAEQIDDFTIDSDVDFDNTAGGNVTLVTSTVTIAATNGESIVTVSNDSSITAED
ncbi:MAG: hypothetical protein CHACPFDD_03980 [Phycisphaerae bacterium]|nr:hypothetical protein [Phycisphaerae bacterium]